MKKKDPILKRIVELNKSLIKSDAKYIDQKSIFPIHITKFLKKKDLFKLLGYHRNRNSLSPIDECSFYYEISKYCSSIRNYFLVSIGMVGSAIFKFGTSRQIKIYINKIINENGIASLAITEKDSGSDINSIKSSYKFDGKNYILNGKKTWITLGGKANIFLILANGSDGLMLFLAEKNKAISIKKLKNITSNRGSEISEISFKNLNVNKENVIGLSQLKSIEALNYALINGRAIAGISAASMSEAALEEASLYATNRKQFGKSICQYQQIQDIISTSAIKIDAALSLCEKTFYLKRKNFSKNKYYCNSSKLFSSKIIIEVTSDLMQVFGANSTSLKYNIERYNREAQGFRYIEGTSQIISQIISNQIILKNRL